MMDSTEEDQLTSTEIPNQTPGFKREMPPAGFYGSGKPVILAKHTENDLKAESPSSPPQTLSSTHFPSLASSTSRRQETDTQPKMLLKTRSDGATSHPSLPGTQPNPPHAIAAGGDTPTSGGVPGSQPMYQIQRNPAVLASNPVSDGSLQTRLAAPAEMKHSVKIIDDAMQWCDSGSDILQDQTDFLTVGVLGMQGVGKSSILSALAGSNPKKLKSYVFRSQDRSVYESGLHQTMGVDMWVTTERVILLDTQPILSPSILDFLIHHEKKLNLEYSSIENLVEMQSLQIATFLLTVCNVIVLVVDNFIDFQLFRFLETAEMLRPSTASHDSSSEDQQEHSPHIVFVLNKCEQADYSRDNLVAMETALGLGMKDSKLKWKGSFAKSERMFNTNMPCMIGGQLQPNLHLLPKMDSSKKTDDSSLPSSYRGHNGFQESLNNLRNDLFSLPRSLITHTSLSEKNWYHFASRTWDSTRKSQLLSEYNRYLT